MQPPVLADLACFHSQQAIEKALKGVLAFLGADTIPRIHDLAELADLVAAAGGGRAPLAEDETERITYFAVGSRYPGHVHVSEEEAAQALESARRVLDWAAELLDRPE